MPASRQTRCVSGWSSGPLLLPQLGHEARPLERRQVVDEYLAYQMIHLVLDAHGKHPLRFELEGFAPRVQSPYPDPRDTPDLVIVAGERQAPFLRLGLALGRNELRVDENAQLVAVSAHIDDDDAFVHINLRGGEPHARGGVESLGHVLDELADFGG